MPACYNSGDFNKYFTENMNALGLEVPSGLFASYDKALTTVTALASALHTLGKGATMAELVGATVGVEQLMVVGAVGGTFYVGACVGSLAVASGRSISCGNSISDLFMLIALHPELQFDDWNGFFARNPEVLNRAHGRNRPPRIRRQMYLAKALAAGGN